MGHLIRYQMIQVRISKKIDWMSFVDILTQYLWQEEMEEKKEFDHIIAQPLWPTDLTNVRVKEENTTTSLIGVEYNACDDSFIAHLYGMMHLQLRIGGWQATIKKRAILEQWYPLNAHTQQLVGIGERYRLPEDEDDNIPEQSEAEPE